MKNRILALFLLGAMLATTLTGCGNKNNTTDNNSPKEKQLVVQVGPDPETIDPALNRTSDGANIILHTFEGLLTYDENEELVPGCAELPNISEDGLTWTFRIKEGLKWSDGSDLNARDFVYSWKRVCDPEVGSPYAYTVLGMVKGYEEAIKGNADALGVTATDDHTLVVELAYPCVYFGSLTTIVALSPVQEKTVTANGENWAVKANTYISNGPFKITDWVPGSHITVSKNEHYQHADKVKLDSIKFVLMEDANASYSAYQSGQVDFIKSVPTEEIPTLSDSPEFHIEELIGTYYLSVNTSKEEFSDPRVRRALSLAIDREYVAETIMQGTYTAAYNFMGEGWLDMDGGSFMENANGGEPYISEDHEVNLAEAKRLLAEAGYPNGEGFPAIQYITNDAGYHITVAEYLQQAWGELGLTVTIGTMEWADFTGRRQAGDFQIARNGWSGDYADPSNQLELFYSENSNNDGQVKNEEYDALIKKAQSSTDVEERFETLHKAEDILMEEMLCIPIAYYNDYWLQKDFVENVWHSPRGLWNFTYADIAK